MNTRELAKAIEDLGISQNETARRANVSVSQMSLIVRGKREPKVSAFKRICQVLGKRAEELW